MTEKFTAHILIVDDDEFFLKLTKHMLFALGYSQVCCNISGTDALAKIDSSNGIPDIIFLDINMPVMDGVEFVRSLAERNYLGKLVLISGEDELMLRAAEKLAKSYQLFVIGRLPKPIKPKDLTRLLEKASPVVKGRAVNDLSRSKSYGLEELNAAIEHDQLVNYYQPKVCVNTGELIGVEALVRWMHPQDGLILPDQFIPVAEAFHLIDKLTCMVVRNALLQVKSWLKQGLELRVAINVSMDNLVNIEFADFVLNEVNAIGVPPHLVMLEVTESRLMQNFTVALDVLTRLRLRRLRLSIDDFGTGHSSLAQLRDFPFDQLKIDRSFSHRAWKDERLKAIFEASRDLANHLGMEIVAEGIEDRDDWIFLQEMNCHVAQGYFIARPMSAERIPDWQKKWQDRIESERLLAVLESDRLMAVAD